MPRAVRVGDTVSWRDANGTFHDAIVSVVTTQDSLTLFVPHINKTVVYDTKAANARRTNMTGTNVWHKEA